MGEQEIKREREEGRKKESILFSPVKHGKREKDQIGRESDDGKHKRKKNYNLNLPHKQMEAVLLIMYMQRQCRHAGLCHNLGITEESQGGKYVDFTMSCWDRAAGRV